MIKLTVALSFLVVIAAGEGGGGRANLVSSPTSEEEMPQSHMDSAAPLPLFIRHETPEEQLPRHPRTLAFTFPFNTEGGQHHVAEHHQHGDEHHQHHGQHHEAHGEDGTHHQEHEHHPETVAAPRLGRQDDEGQTDNTVDLGEVAAAGERCVEKVMMVEELQYDEQIECHHSYDQRCHTTYTTDYEPQQEEVCDENFVKNCYIEYKTVAFDEPVEICNEKLVRNCDKPGPTVCEKVYESECETSYHEHEVEEDVPECRIMQVEKCRDITQGYSTRQECDKWPKQVCDLKTKTVKRYSPDTQCKKKPRDICGPGPCPIEQGPRECRQESRTVTQEVPEETCDLNPQKVCKFVTKLVPVLKPQHNCVDVPKEVCTRARRNPRKIKRPVIKKWCYTPRQEEDEADSDEQQQDNDDSNDNNDDDNSNNPDTNSS